MIDVDLSIDKTYSLLANINYNELPISDYNKKYIARMKPVLHYYLKIHMCCIEEGLINNSKPLSDITMVDFGGGSGFLSIMAKIVGIGKVIYVDLNEKSVKTITLLKEMLGVGPDIILHGSSDSLANWCEENKIQPELLIATDLIEHVYNLNVFFKELISVNNNMKMVFTTGSTPFNPYIKRKLYNIMDSCERGNLEQPNYLIKRAVYIKETFPNLSVTEVKTWVKKTRGLIYEDIKKVIENNQNIIPHKHNTCDPETGNWTERILPIKEYENILIPYEYKVEVKKGFYNITHQSKIKTKISKVLNVLIKKMGKSGLYIAPFIILVCGKKDN